MLAPMAAAASSSGTGSFAATPTKPSSAWDVSAQTGDFSWSYPLRTPPAAAGPSPSLSLQYTSQSVDGETGSTNNQPSAVGEGWELSGAGGYIERTYVGCAQDSGPSGPVLSSGDLCWKTDNATISVGGHSGQLIKDQGTGRWRLSSDDGSRFEHLTGAAQGCGASNGSDADDCWKMTTTDGTQYFFGLNKLPGWKSGDPTTNSAWTVPVFGNDAGEPCHATTFASSSCVQAWRWNLDYVVDTHSNAEVLYYDAETNKYSKNGAAAVEYVRSGHLNHIDYGLTASNLLVPNAASDRVNFAYNPYGRCSDSTHSNCTNQPVAGLASAPAHAAYYPDAPFDQLCTDNSCANKLSPTFWTTAMLDTVSTQYLKAGSYVTVDSWALDHSFPNPGDGTSAALWLTQVVHTGGSGSSAISEPATTFTGATLQNRVWVKDGLAPLDKYRITSIHESLGAITSVNYAASDCTTENAAAIVAAPESNNHRCYPQWWTPDTTFPQPAQKDLFNKYVVTSVVSDPHTGGGADRPRETHYLYTGTPAWRWDTSPLTKESRRTWSVYAGYNQVETRVGSPDNPSTQATTIYTFFQGLDGDRASTSGGTKAVSVIGSPGVADSRWFAGQIRESKTLNGVGGAVLSDTVSTPWASAVTSSDGENSARFVRSGETLLSEPLSTGGSRTVDTKMTYDASYGLPSTVSRVSSDAGASCTTTTYVAPNLTAWIVELPKEVASVQRDCDHVGSAVYPSDAISDKRTTYDAGSWGDAAVKGDATKSQIVHGYNGSSASSARWVTDSESTFDALGRPSSTKDVAGHVTTTQYTPAADAASGSGPLTKQVVTTTSPFSWTTTTTIDPAWGSETSTTDRNGKTTSTKFDALGRRVQIWLPLHPESANPTSPSAQFAYVESTNSVNSVAATVLGPVSSLTTYTLYDGLGQVVQTQAPAAAGGGAVVTDTAYDASGRMTRTNNPYWTTADPSGTQFFPTSQSQIPSVAGYVYDGADRPIVQTLESVGAEKSRTITAYVGADRVDVTPPLGGTPTSTFGDSQGRMTKLVQYLSSSPSASVPQETTSYTYNALGLMASMVDAAGNAWRWAYDVMGNKVQADDPDAGITRSTFDDLGNVLTTTDARGKLRSYTYDELNRPTAVYEGSAGSGSLLSTWLYDTLTKGQQTSSTTYVGSTPGHPGLAYTISQTGYNAAYQPTGTTLSVPVGAPAFGGNSYTVTKSYNPDGSPSFTNEPAVGGLPAEKIKYKYASSGKLLGVAGQSVILSTINYTALGQVSELARTGGAILDYSDFAYDQATGALKEHLNQSFAGSVSKVVSDEHWSYDAAGNVISNAVSADGVATDTQCFTYDHLRELTAAWTPTSNDCSVAPSRSNLGGPAPYWNDYAVDPATGNRKSLVVHSPSSADTSSTYAYPPAASAHPHAAQSVTTTGTSNSVRQYGYDESGNTVERPQQTVGYDVNGRVSAVTSAVQTESNVYDVSGNLLLRSDSQAGTTLFMGDTELHRAASGSAETATRTYLANGVAIAERTSSTEQNGTLHWLVTDNQNSATVEIDATSGVVTRRYQDPFGGSRGVIPTWSSDHTFLNGTTSAGLGLVHLGAREYDSSIGRFLSVDPQLAPANPQENNAYSYSANNPTTFADPSGKCYEAGSDSLSHSVNCAGGHGVSAPGAAPSAPKAAGNGGPSLSSLWWKLAGFHETKKGILQTRAHPVQLSGGYNDAYDMAFKAAGTGAQAQKFPFEYNGTSYVAWMWKGQYINMGYGAEVGFYSQKVPLIEAGPLWNSDSEDHNLPLMSVSLDYKDSKVASFAPAKPQVWVGAWNPKMGSWDPANADANAADLHARVAVTFPNADVYDAFRNSTSVSGGSDWTFDQTTRTATINY